MFARTERLLLRPSWPEDAQAIHAAISDEAIVRNLARAPWPYRECDAVQFARLEHGTMFPNFLAVLRTDGPPQLVGSCGLGERDGEAELGYWIARPFWGQGLAAEAAKAVIGVAKALGHQRLVAGHFTDNPASGRVLQKVGFRPTGRVEPRYSAGRGREVPCVLFELSLSDDAEQPVDMPFTRAHDGEAMLRAA